MAADNQKTIKIGISGHLNLTTGQLTALRPVLTQAIKNIKQYHLYADKTIPHIIFISPIAIGADTLFANVALKPFKGELRVYLPFKKDEYLKDFETTEQKQEFEHLLKHSKIIEELYTGEVTNNNRNKLYLQVGKKIVDECDYLIAIWDEQKAKGVGGTGDVVQYALSRHKDVLVINPENNKPIIKGNYLYCINNCPDDKPKPENLGDNIVQDYFEFYDLLAIHNQVAYKNIWESCFRIGWLAALILSVKMAFNFTEDIQFILTISEIILLGGIFLLIMREKNRNYHKNYLKYRFFAERLRINNLVYRCGYYPIKSETKVIHKALQQMESEFPVNTLNKIIRLTSYTSDSLDDKKVFIKAFADSQSSYHLRRKTLLEKLNSTNSLIKKVCIAVFVAVVLSHGIAEFPLEWFKSFNKKDMAVRPETGHPFYLQISFVLYLFIPATVARFEGAKFLNDWERLITQSVYMNVFFNEISNRIDLVKDDNELYDLLTELNENMYLENLDWEMFMSNKNENMSI